MKYRYGLYFISRVSGNEVYYQSFSSKSYAEKIGRTKLIHDFVIKKYIPFCDPKKVWYYQRGV